MYSVIETLALAVVATCTSIIRVLVLILLPNFLFFLFFQNVTREGENIQGYTAALYSLSAEVNMKPGSG